MDRFVDLYLVRFAEDQRERWAAGAQRWLSDAELVRAQRIQGQDARLRHMLGRALIRLLGAQDTGLQPHQVEIAVADQGKPLVVGAQGLEISVSHSGSLVVAAAARGVAVGVDAESAQRRRFDPYSLVRRGFAESEVAAFQAVPAEQAAQEFVRYWTVKEAVGKALGYGIFPALQGVVVELSDSGPRLVAVAEGPDAGVWTVHQLQAPGGSETVAVALPAPQVPLRAVHQLGADSLAAGTLPADGR